ncbi:MAG TPA: hypothetical protein QGH16_04090 [Verrucomicrobiota bacterium]|jgi:Ca2+-binding EF-hand superfamily protein|nr:hypothetical protein [Verrucomicrobiota bacterium]
MKIKTIRTLAAAALLTGSLSVLQAEDAKKTNAKAKQSKRVKEAKAGKVRSAKPAAKKDARPSREAIIKRFDKDGDGKLSEAERAAARKAMAGAKSDRVSGKARPKSDSREQYAAMAKKLREGVKAGKLTEKQAKEKLTDYRKKLAQGQSGSDRSRQTREELMKRYDKNGDGKLDERERAALRKSLSGRRGQRGADARGGERGERTNRGDVKRRSEGAERKRRVGQSRGESPQKSRRGKRRGGE